MRLAMLLCLMTILMPAAAAVAQDDPPRREGRVTGGPPPEPIVQGLNEPDILPCGVDGNLNDGMPYLPTIGKVKAAMLFVDFDEFPADEPDTQAIYDRLVPGVRLGLNALSRGRFDLEVTSVPRWLRMPNALKTYGFDDEADVDALNRYARDAVQAAGSSLDFSQYQALYVVAPKKTEIHAFAHTDQEESPWGVPGQRAISVLYTGDDALTLLHETGHLLGLDDLYSYSKGTQDYVGPWDVMSEVWNDGAPLLAWTRFQARWAPRKAFRCVSRTTTGNLVPSDAPAGPKVMLVRTGDTVAYVLEAQPRSPEIGCPAAGVLIYKVDTRKASGEGSVRVADARPRGLCEDVSDGPFRVGSSYRSPGGRFTVDVLEQTADGFRVKVKVPRSGCVVPNVIGKRYAFGQRKLRAANCWVGRVSGGQGRIRDQAQEAGTVLGRNGAVDLRLR